MFHKQLELDFWARNCSELIEWACSHKLNRNSYNSIDTYALILIGGDCSKYCLSKNKCFTNFSIQLSNWSVRQTLALFSSTQNQVNSWLIFVHRIQYNLFMFFREWACQLELVDNSGMRFVCLFAYLYLIHIFSQQVILG